MPSDPVKPLRTRPLERRDAERLSLAFREIGWSKPSSIFLGYLEECTSDDRWVLVADWDGDVAGYVTLLWESRDPVFRDREIPEIVDLNVLPRFRGRGIGNALLDEAEVQARRRSEIVGLRVGLHSGYGGAQRLYVRRGYVPDGAGALKGTEVIEEGARIILDDDVTIRMLKRLSLADEPRAAE